jgi:hypothetical protein
LRRVLLLDIHATRAAITDGQLDKQIDAIVVEDGDDRRVRVIQGKFTKPSSPVDAAPVREVLSAWERLRDLPSLQVECSGKLAERLEAMRVALEEDYEVQFELLTTGVLTEAALTDVDAFRKLMSDSTEFSAGLTVVDSDLIETRLSEAEQKDLPELNTSIELDKHRYIESTEGGVRVVIAMLPVEKCLKLPGIVDQKLFRRNVRQNLGLGNKVNKGIRETLTNPQKSPYLFFFHNGITALCRSLDVSDDVLSLKGFAVVNGCQSISTIYSTSGKIAQKQGTQGALLFRFYEIYSGPQNSDQAISGSAREFVETANWRRLVSVLPFLGWLASEFRLCTADLRQLRAESSAGTESLQYWNSRMVPGGPTGLTPYLTVSSGLFGRPGTHRASYRTIPLSWRVELLPAHLRSPMCRTAAVGSIRGNGRFPTAAASSTRAGRKAGEHWRRLTSRAVEPSSARQRQPRKPNKTGGSYRFLLRAQ